MPSNYPTTVHAIPNPGPATYRDDPGYELDLLVSNLGDILEAVQTKLGIGASVPAANQVLRGVGIGTSSFGQVLSAMIAAGEITAADVRLGSAGTQTTTASSYSTLQKMSLPITCEAGDQLLCWFMGAFLHSVASGAIVAALRLNGAAELYDMSCNPPTVGAPLPMGTMALFSAVAGVNTVDVRWLTGSGTATANGNNRYLLVLRRRR